MKPEAAPVHGTGRTVLRFFASATLIYVVLMAPWPGLQTAYTAVFRTACKAFTGPVGQNGHVALDPRGGDPLLDTWFRLRRLDTRTAVRNGIVSRYIGYLPAVLVVALVLATPLPWSRRRRALAWALLWIHLFIAVRVAASTYSDFITSPQVVLVQTGPATRAITLWITRLLNETVISIVAAVVVWGATTFRKGDLERLLIPGSADPVEPTAR